MTSFVFMMTFEKDETREEMESSSEKTDKEGIKDACPRGLTFVVWGENP